jgi:hypothetical protein
MSGEERYRRKNCGSPRQAEFLSDQGGGKVEFAGDHQVGLGSCDKQVVVSVLEVWKEPVSIKRFESVLKVLAIPDESGVGWIPIGSNGVEAYPRRFNMGAVVFSGCDDH